MSDPAAPDGPSDPGLAGERTSLAWARMGLSLLAIPAGLLAYTAAEDRLVAVSASLVAALAGLGLLVASLRRQRAAAGMVSQQAPVLAGRQVLLSAVTVLFIGIAALELVVT